MQAGSITVMSFLSFNILRKVEDENENVWDDFINGASLLTPKSQPPSLAPSL